MTCREIECEKGRRKGEKERNPEREVNIDCSRFKQKEGRYRKDETDRVRNRSWESENDKDRKVGAINRKYIYAKMKRKRDREI